MITPWKIKETQLLIKLVKPYQVLYDATHSMYKEDSVTIAIWKAIAEKIENRCELECFCKWEELLEMYNGEGDTTELGPFVADLQYLEPFLGVTDVKGLADDVNTAEGRNDVFFKCVAAELAELPAKDQSEFRLIVLNKLHELTFTEEY